MRGYNKLVMMTRYSETVAFLDVCSRNRASLTKYTCKNVTTCSKSANKPSTSCVRMACCKLSTSLEQAVNNL